MIPTQRKADLFFITADFIEQNPEFYNWGNPRTCNCGILATIINPKLANSSDFCKLGSYTHAFNDSHFICSTTGIYLNEVMQSLVEAGFTPEDIKEIEFTNLDLDTYVGDNYPYADSDLVVKYFRDTAKQMQQTLLSQQTKLKATTVPVSV